MGTNYKTELRIVDVETASDSSDRAKKEMQEQKWTAVSVISQKIQTHTPCV